MAEAFPCRRGGNSSAVLMLLRKTSGSEISSSLVFPCISIGSLSTDFLFFYWGGGALCGGGGYFYFSRKTGKRDTKISFLLSLPGNAQAFPPVMPRMCVRTRMTSCRLASPAFIDHKRQLTKEDTVSLTSF